MSPRAHWREGETPRPVTADGIATLWAEVESRTAEAVVLVVEQGGAELHAVIGEQRGTVLVYFPADYEATATGSLHSVGDRAGAERDEWGPPVTASCLGHHSEFPKWMVVPHAVGREALAHSCAAPHVPPPGIEWERD